MIDIKMNSLGNHHPSLQTQISKKVPTFLLECRKSMKVVTRITDVTIILPIQLAGHSESD